MKKTLILAVALLAVSCGGCKTLETPSSLYVQADRATFDSLAPTMKLFLDNDPSNDPQLSDLDRASLLTLIDSWELRLKNAESLGSAAVNR